jgi:urease accessory protein
MISAALSPSDPVSALERLRVQASLRLDVHRQDGQTRLTDLAEGGGYRIKFPTSAPAMEAVIVNTGGGLLGGDTFAIAVQAGEDTALSLTTQSAEKVYRAIHEPSRVSIALGLAARSRLDWMPQECILFDGAALRRQITAEMAEDSTLLIAESVTFGRLAMGEVMASGLLRDRWRISRAGRLVFADDVALEGAMADKLDHPAIGAGARAAATLLLIAPDAEARLDSVRALPPEEGVDSGASAWNGLLLVRMMAADPALLRQAMIRILTKLRGVPVPRSW